MEAEELRPDAPHQAPPAPKNEAETHYLYRLDPETKLPVVVGKVFVDKHRDAWVRINSTALAEALGVEDIDGVALLDGYTFDALEE